MLTSCSASHGLSQYNFVLPVLQKAGGSGKVASLRTEGINYGNLTVFIYLTEMLNGNKKSIAQLILHLLDYLYF